MSQFGADIVQGDMRKYLYKSAGMITKGINEVKDAIEDAVKLLQKNGIIDTKWGIAEDPILKGTQYANEFEDDDLSKIQWLSKNIFHTMKADDPSIAGKTDPTQTTPVPDGGPNIDVKK